MYQNTTWRQSEGLSTNWSGIFHHSRHHPPLLPTRGEFKQLEGAHLQHFQQAMSTIRYIIIDEMSMVGRKMFGQIDHRLRQAFPHHAQEVFGGCSVLLFGDFGQLPPVMDLPLYTTDSRLELSDQERTAYLQFDKAFVLMRVMCQSGTDPAQVRFRDILLRLRNAEVTTTDWKELMQQTPTKVQDLTLFANALHLYPTVEAVVELKDSGQPLATIKAVHTGANASSDDASGLEAVVCLAKSAWCHAHQQPVGRSRPCKWGYGHRSSHLLQEWRPTRCTNSSDGQI